MKLHVFHNDIPDGLQIDGDLAIDTEAMGLNIPRDRLCLIQISNNTENAYLIKFNKNYEANNLKALLSQNNSQKIFHFARFDIAIIKHYLGISMENIFCTKIASRLVRTYTEAHGLKNLCREFLGKELQKKHQSSDWGADVLSPEQKQYAVSDVLYLHKLRDSLYKMLERENRLSLAYKIFNFLNTRAELDLLGWGDFDIFAHSKEKKISLY